MRPIQRVARLSETPPPAVGDASDRRTPTTTTDALSSSGTNRPAFTNSRRSSRAIDSNADSKRRPPGLLPLADREQRTAAREADNEARREQRTRARRGTRRQRSDCDAIRSVTRERETVRQASSTPRTQPTSSPPVGRATATRTTHARCKNRAHRLSRSHEDHEGHEELLSKRLRGSSCLRAFVRSCRSGKNCDRARRCLRQFLRSSPAARGRRRRARAWRGWRRPRPRRRSAW